MVMESNADVLRSLGDFYNCLADNQLFDLQNNCRDDILIFVSQIDDMIYDSNMQIARAKILAKFIDDRKSTVNHSTHVYCHLLC
jgi:hypothetical protein